MSRKTQSNPVRRRTDPKTVQTLLRHSDVKLTGQFHSEAVSQDRIAAPGEMLTAILSYESGLRPSNKVRASPFVRSET
jgi:hypothetical protein